MGAQTDLAAGDLRWLSPLPLWTGILAGPLAWALDLCASFALVKCTASGHREIVLQLMSPAALALVIGGTAVSWLAFTRTPAHLPTDGGDPLQRARFMAILGLLSNGLFALSIVASAIPRWVLNACQ